MESVNKRPFGVLVLGALQRGQLRAQPHREPGGEYECGDQVCETTMGESCERCHAQGGSLAERAPRLAGQWTEYLATTLKYVPTGEHTVPLGKGRVVREGTDCTVVAYGAMVPVAEAAAEGLRAGGNAFDAVLAALSVACVVEPVLCTPGGGGFLLARPAGEKPRVYDFFVQTPAVRHAESDLDFRPILADFGGVTQEFHIGHGTAAVPGLVRGLFDIHRDLGTLRVGDELEILTEMARDGDEGIDAELETTWASTSRTASRAPSQRRFRRDGWQRDPAPRPGTDAPARMNTASAPKASCNASAAARMAGWSVPTST